MAKAKLRIRVVGLNEMQAARRAIEDGAFRSGAAKLNDFCNANYTMRGEHGEMWGDIKIAVLGLLGLAEGDKDGAQRIVGKLWQRIVPHLTEERAQGARR
jgi:hypothetical protein